METDAPMVPILYIEKMAANGPIALETSLLPWLNARRHAVTTGRGELRVENVGLASQRLHIQNKTKENPAIRRISIS